MAWYLLQVVSFELKQNYTVINYLYLYSELMTPLLPEDWRAECGFPDAAVQQLTLNTESTVILVAAVASSGLKHK